MYVLQDDTFQCKTCHEESYPDGEPTPAHREVFAEVDHGECESCGIMAGELIDEWEERVLGSSELSIPGGTP